MPPVEQYRIDEEIKIARLITAGGFALAGSSVSMAFEMFRRGHRKSAAVMLGVGVMGAAVGAASFENALDVSNTIGILQVSRGLIDIAVSPSGEVTVTQGIIPIDSSSSVTPIRLPQEQLATDGWQPGDDPTTS